MDARFVAVTLALQQAIRVVKAKARKEGRIRVSEISAGQWSAWGREYLQAHRELIDAELQRDLCWELARPRRRRAVSYYQITAKG